MLAHDPNDLTGTPDICRSVLHMSVAAIYQSNIHMKSCFITKVTQYTCTQHDIHTRVYELRAMPTQCMYRAKPEQPGTE